MAIELRIPSFGLSTFGADIFVELLVMGFTCKLEI